MILSPGTSSPVWRSRHVSTSHHRSTLERHPQRFPPERPDASRLLPPRNISLASFRYHFYKPRSSKPASSDDRSSASADHHFLPVTILPDPILSITASQPHLELVLSNGRRIAVAPGFDTQTLRRLIAAVEERPCSD